MPSLKNKKTDSTPKRSKPAAVVSLPSFVRQHEQAILVSLAYVIGFTTAFIAFCLSGDTNVSVPHKLAADASDVSSGLMTELEAMVLEGDLVVVNGSEEHTLSVFSEDSDGRDGIHYDISIFSTSPDNHFVYYCVQTAENSSTCDSFIYDVNAELIYRVKAGNTQMAFDIKESKTARWSEDGLLQLADYESTSSDTPWEMVAH